MSGLWKWIDSKDISRMAKATAFITLNCLIYSILGLLLWLFIRRYVFSTFESALCFVGYPGFFIGYIGSFIFLYRH